MTPEDIAGLHRNLAKISPDRRQCGAIVLIWLAFHAEDFAGNTLPVAAHA